MTGNLRHFPARIRMRHGVAVISPRAFLDALGRLWNVSDSLKDVPVLLR